MDEQYSQYRALITSEEKQHKISGEPKGLVEVF